MTFELTPDELAGIVDLFGALTDAELHQATEELAFKAGVAPPPASIVEDAIATYHLVRTDDLLVVGPTAFPTLPADAVDLPHILQIEQRAVDRDTIGNAVERRFRQETAQAVAADDQEAIRRLLDVSYDLETWTAVDLEEVRSLLPEPTQSV